ncbi:hypothetical protein OHW19_16755 [Acinetobacter baumannii]|nr:hypothetical protein [Acinetobacter baumannii]MDC4998223.1 hypothetical protein [Acinetobacter baumannii]
MDFINQHLSEILSFLGGIIAGGIGGISITKYTSKNNNSKKVIQKGIQAGGDVAAGNINQRKK